MVHWKLVVVSYTAFILCQSLESQKLITLKHQEEKWSNQTQYLRQGPKWPEQYLKQHYPVYSFKSYSSQRNMLPKTLQAPQWPKIVLHKNETKKLQNHITWSSQTIQPFGIQARLTSKRKALIPKIPELALHAPNLRVANSNIERSTKSMTPENHQQKQHSTIEPQELYKVHSEHGKRNTKNVVRPSMTDTGLGIGGDFSYERHSFDAADTDFVSFLMVQADEMAEAMTELFATRRIPHYFTVHHTRCLGVNSYCREACFQVEQNVCRRFKCTRQVKEYLTKQCRNCNVRAIRNFPRKLLLSLDFLKAREVYNKITNRTFESFYPPKYLRPFYSKNQPGAPRPEDFSYYTDNSNQ
ncbi:hypothetical protein O0L34_g5921 [Tuta absoluta]|nr:hypothetical protein O0L34_g5921 [Tuta absoluta]